MDSTRLLPRKARRLGVAALLALLAVLMLVLTLALAMRPGGRTQVHGHPPAQHHASARFDADADTGAWEQDLGPTQPLLPLHQAVALAAGRFSARPIAVRLTPPEPGDPADVAVVYRIRLLTAARQVIDLRMDAVSGRIVELRGADLIAARRN